MALVNLTAIARTTTLVIFACAAAHAQESHVAAIPDALPPAVRAEFATAYEALMARIDAHNLKRDDFMVRCGHIPNAETARIATCVQEYQTVILPEENTLEADKKRFAARLSAAVAAQAVRNERQFAEPAARLVKALDTAAAKLDLPKGPATDRALATLNCQAFVRAVGDELEPTTGTASWSGDFKGLNAAEIVTAIDNEATRGGSWQRLSGADVLRQAQDLANGGAVVVGGSSDDGSGHGHLGFVVPIPGSVDPDNFAGRGPFVRDGNEHQPKSESRAYPSTWGAVKASKAFVLSKTSWYVWTPSNK